jgi:hypothetical protein
MPRADEEYGPAHAEAAVVHVELGAALIPVPHAGPKQDDVARSHLLPPVQAVVDARAADGEGDLHEAVRVHRTVVIVQVRDRVGQRPVGEVEQPLLSSQRRVLHLREHNPLVTPKPISC